MFSFFYEDSSMLYGHVVNPFGFWKRATAEVQSRWQLLTFDESQESHQYPVCLNKVAVEVKWENLKISPIDFFLIGPPLVQLHCYSMVV
jgi:hypothetical protein